MTVAVLIFIAFELLVVCELLRRQNGISTGHGYRPLRYALTDWLHDLLFNWRGL